MWPNRRAPSDTILLTAFTDDAFSVVLTPWAIPILDWPNESVCRFSADGIGPFSSFNVGVFDGEREGVDVGTGIDNIGFTAVPELGTLELIGAGLLGLG